MKHRILDQKGQGLTEYITLLLLVSICSVAVAKTLGNTIKKKMSEAESHINQGISLENESRTP